MISDEVVPLLVTELARLDRRAALVIDGLHVVPVITVFVDVFRSRDLSGWSKALWTLFVIFLPFLGVFSYLIARGDKIADRGLGEARESQGTGQAYVR